MTFRFARHTNDIKALKYFYTTILGLEVLGSFENHDKYDGVFIGKSDKNWHLEFTQSNEKVNFNFGEEDYLVFYPSTLAEYKQIQTKITKNNIKILISKNPYWNKNGIIINDPDGYAIIISNLKAK